MNGALTVAREPGALRVSGDVDLASAPLLARALAALIESGDEVHVDLHEVTFMDGAGVHVLVEAAQSLHGRGRLVLDRPSPPVSRVFEVLGVPYSACDDAARTG